MLTGISIMTSTNAAVIEPFLVDQNGRAVYVYTQDTQNSGTSACTGDCATTWPPVVVTETPTAGTGASTGQGMDSQRYLVSATGNAIK